MEVQQKFDFTALRGLRKSRNLTLEELSSQSGVSIAVISKLERNQCSAELDTLFKIARVFGMSATDLLALAESPLAHQVTEGDHESGGFVFREIRYANSLVLMGTAFAGAEISRPEIHRDDYEICWVLEGELELKLPHETIRLTEGQSVQFDAILEHTYRCMHDVRLIIIHLRKDKRY